MDVVNKHDIQIPHLSYRNGEVGVRFSGIIGTLCLPVLQLKETVWMTS